MVTSLAFSTGVPSFPPEQSVLLPYESYSSTGDFLNFLCISPRSSEKFPNPISWPKFFTLSIWVFLDSGYDCKTIQQVILEKPNHIYWTFDSNLNGLSFTIMNSLESMTYQYLEPLLYFRWYHLSIVNGEDGLKVRRYGNHLISEFSPNQISNTQKQYVFIGSSHNNENPFSGMISDINLFSTALSTDKLELLFLFSTKQQSLPLYALFFETNFGKYKILDRDMITSSINRIIDVSPRFLSNIFPSIYGKNVTLPTRYPFFSGKSYFYFLLEHNLTPFYFYSKYCVSFWFKYIPTQSSSPLQTLVYISKCLKIQYYQPTEINNHFNASASLLLINIPDQKSIQLKLPKISGLWLQVIALIDIKNNKIDMEVPGYGKNSMYALEIPQLFQANEVRLGYGNDDYYFTGMMCEFILSYANLREYSIIYSPSTLTRMKQDVSSFSILKAHLMDQSEREIFPYSFQKVNIEWKTDPSNFSLCPMNSIAEFNFPNNSVWCRDFIVMGKKKSKVLSPFSLTLPPTAWTTDGSLCLSVIVDVMTYFNKQILVKYGNFVVMWGQERNYSTGDFSILDGSNFLFTSNMSFSSRIWQSLCFGFKKTSSTEHTLFMANSYTQDKIESGALPLQSFLPSGRITFFPNQDFSYYTIKNILILNKEISPTEHLFYHYLHPEFVSSLGSSILAWWPLNDTGNFSDPITGTTSQRTNTSISGGISSSGLQDSISGVGSRYNFVIDDTNSYYALREREGIHKFYPIIKLSIDFSDLVDSPWVAPRFPSQSDVRLFLNSTPYRPEQGFVSRYHGLVLQNPGYKSSFASITTSISTAWLSIWFNKKDSTQKVLISGYGGTGQGTKFTISINTAIVLTGPTLATSSDSSVISPNSWHHLFVLWNSSTSLYLAYMIDNGVPQSLNVVNTGFSEVSDSQIVLGVELDPSGTPLTSTIFEGYIRRLELVNHEAYQPLTINELNSLMPDLIKKFISLSGCDTQYNSCPFCDLFSMQCFTTVNHEWLPDNSAPCPADCASVNFTSCDSPTTCSGCHQFACLACSNKLCTRCYNNLAPDVNGNCGCADGYLLNYTILKCEACYATCKTCSVVADYQKCQTCKEGYVFHNLDGSNGQCLPSCPPSYINIRGNCTLNCHGSCATCSAANDPSKCLSCKGERKYLLGSSPSYCVSTCPKNSIYSDDFYCYYCDSSCAECQLPGNASACYSCSNSSLYFTPLHEGANIGTCTTTCLGTYMDTVNMKCQSCPIYTYQDESTHKCLKCHNSCFGCTEAENANKCLGCHSKYPYLKLASKTATSGECSTMCSANERVIKKFICIPNEGSPVYVDSQAHYFNLAVVRIALSVMLIGVSVSIIFLGSFELIIITLGNLQAMMFYALISVPSLPLVLSTFYSHMDFAFFEYLPNIFSSFSNEHSGPVFSHPALPSNLFLINIGNLLFLGAVILCLFLIVRYLSPISSLAEKLNQKMFIMLHEVLLISLSEMCLSWATQFISFNSNYSAFSWISLIMAVLAAVSCLSYCYYVVNKLRQERNNPEVLQSYSCFHIYYNDKEIVFYSILNFLLLRIISVIVVFGHSSPKFQIFILLAVNAYMLFYDAYFTPYRSTMNFISSIVHDVTHIAASCLYYFLNKQELEESSADKFGFAIFSIFIGCTLMDGILSMISSVYQIVSYFISPRQVVIQDVSVQSISENIEK